MRNKSISVSDCVRQPSGSVSVRGLPCNIGLYSLVQIQEGVVGFFSWRNLVLPS